MNTPQTDGVSNSSNDDTELLQKKLNLTIDYLNNVNLTDSEDPSLFVKTYEELVYLSKRLQTDYMTLVSKNCHLIFINILESLLKTIDMLDFSTDLAIESENSSDSESEFDKKTYFVNIFSLVFYMINSISEFSSQFVQRITQNGGIKIFLSFLNDSSFVNRCLEATMTLVTKQKVPIIDYIILNINKCNNVLIENPETIKELNILDTLFKILKIKKSCEMDAYNSILKLADDDLLENSTDIHKFAKDLCEKLKICASDFNEKRFNRQVRQIMTSKSKKLNNVELHCLNDNGVSRPVTSLFQLLYSLSVNDKMRQLIFYDFNFKSFFSSILYELNSFELNMMLRFICQLTFCSKICTDLASDTKFYEFIKLKTDDESSHPAIRRFCGIIYWNLEQSQSEINIRNTELFPQHVMISYNHKNRDVCTKIKSRLEFFGNKVWIGMNDGYHASLESMARAIHESFCVLICVSEKYRQSLNCQAEAMYAHKLNKPIIPLIMDSGYENVKGWLGGLIENKMFIKFTKNEFEDSIGKLKNEIFKLDTTIDRDINIMERSIESFPDHVIQRGLRLTPDLIHPTIMSQDSHTARIDELSPTPDIRGSESAPVSFPNVAPSSKPVQEWNKKEVKDWLWKSKIKKKLIQVVYPCDGMFLNQLYKLKCEAPEFYYQSLNKNHNLDLQDLFWFNSNLEALFKKE